MSRNHACARARREPWVEPIRLKPDATYTWAEGAWPQARPTLLIRALRRRSVNDHGAAFHHPSDFIDQYVDVGERIAVDRDDVGEVPGREGAEALLHAE